MTVKNFKVKNGLTVGAGATIYGNGNIDVAGIITAATFKGDGSGLINVTALGTGIQINNNGSIIGIGSIINFGTNIAVSPVFAGITTISGSTNPIPGISTTGSSFFNELQVGAAATFSGEVEVADYIRHKGDTNTAIRFPTDDTFSVVTGSLERFRVESDGEIGIGTDTPRAKLDVDGTIYSAGNIKLYDNVKLQFGDSQDLSLYHGVTASYLSHTGTGNLYIDSDTVALRKVNQHKYFLGQYGVSYLYHTDTQRLKTTGTGVDISDTLNVAGVSTFTGNSTFDGHIGIGTTAITGATVRIASDNIANPIEATLYDTGVSGATIFLQHSKNNTVGVAKSLSVNDEIGSIEFRSYAGNDTSISRAARIMAIADADPTDTKVKSALVFETSSAGISGTADERLRISSSGYMQMKNASGSTFSLLRNTATTTTTDLLGAIDFGSLDWDSNTAQIASYQDGAKDKGSLRFYTQAAVGSGIQERLRITSDGDVSIGSSITVGGISKFNGSVGISSALLDKDGDKGSSGQVLSSTGSQVNWINVGSIAAGAASSIAVGTNNSTDETVYPLFADGTSGNQGAEVDTGFTYNPSTGVLTATQFTGSLSGNAGSATQLQTARNIGGVAFDGTANINLPGVNAAGNQNTSGTAAGLSGTPDITVDEIGTRNINVSGVTTTAAVNWGGHMLPTSNAAYDIGSAELKVRHLFLSDNSLKFVDAADVEHPLSLDSGRLKFGGGMLLGTTIKVDAASGIVTATTFSGALSGNAATATKLAATKNIGGTAFDGSADITPGVAGGLTGTPNITVGVLNASSGTVSGNLDVQGTLTYVNVDNVTSTGIGTFKKGIQIHGDGLDVVGIATFGTGIGVTGNITVTGNVDGRDIAADGTKLDTIATSANNYTHPNHSGEVTSTADGATVIASDIVDEDNLKISNTGTNGQFLQKQSGNSGGLTWATPNDNNTWRAIDDTPVDGVTDESISSNWAFDHAAATGNSGHVPTAGTAGQFLKHDGTWGTPNYTTNTDNDTTYSISCVDGDNTDEEKIRLTAGGDGSGTDDIVLEAGTGLTIARSGDKITFTNSETDTNTTYDLLVPESTTAIRLDPSDATGNDDISITGGTNVTVTRTSGTELTISSTDTNTDTNDYVNSLSFATGTGVLTAGRTGSLGNLTVDLDGRYLQSHGLTFGAGLQLDGSAVSSTAAREQNITWTATVGTAQDMWTIAHNTADTFEITIYAKSGSHKQVQKMLVMHDGTTAYHNQYAVMYTSAARLYDFSAVISGTNLKIRVTPLTGADTSTNGSNVHWRYAVLGNSGN